MPPREPRNADGDGGEEPVPGMEHREESICAPDAWVGRNGAQRLADGPEQNVVDDVLILQSNGCDWLRQSEDT